MTSCISCVINYQRIIFSVLMTFAKEKARKNVCEKFLIEIIVFELKRSGISYLFWARWFLFGFRSVFK